MNPLFLPKGTIRAILVLAMTVFVFIAVSKGNTLPEVYCTAWLLVLGYYFGIRSEFNK